MSSRAAQCHGGQERPSDFRHVIGQAGGQHQHQAFGECRVSAQQVADLVRVGVGCNFTDFSDDMTNLRYDNKSWFLNIVGYY